MSSTRRTSYLFPFIAVLFFISGATALIYQVGWLRSLLLIFGSTAFAVSTVLTSFMAGLAAGSWAVGRWIDRQARPLAVYGALEVAIGVYALAVPYMLDALEPLYRGLWVTLQPPTHVFALMRFALGFAVLFVPTAMMGGTLPVLARFAAGTPRNVVGSVGALYGINTLGAFLGTMLSGFLLLPTYGLSRTLHVAAAVNIGVGLLALALAWRAGEQAREADSDVVVVGTGEDFQPQPRSARSARRLVAGAFAVTGLAALTLEVAWTKVLTLVIGPSVYAFSLMLAAFLAGLGLGSAIFSWAIARFRWSGVKPFVVLSAVAGLLAFVTTLAFHRLPFLYAALFQRWNAVADPGVIFAIGLLLSGLVMLPAALAMGGLFPAALEAFGLSPGAAGRAVGGLYAANSGGAIVGAFGAGFALIPLLGLQGTVLLAAWLYLAVAAALAWAAMRGRRAAWLLPIAAAALGPVLYAVAPAWDRMLMSSGVYHYLVATGGSPSPAEFDESARGYEVLFYEEGLVSTILVAREPGVYGRLGEDSVPSVFLVTNGKVDASSVADMPTQILSAHIPLLLHPEPKRVAVVGLASGTTAGSALRHDIQSLDVVEIEPAVVAASHEFDFVNGRPLDDPRTRLTVADGRSFLLLADKPFDVIISEPSNPWISGVSNLFTREYFQIVRSRLAEGGMFAQWVQMYGMSPENVRVLLRTFRSVFPNALLFNTIPYTDLVLIGSAEPLRIDVESLERRIARPAVLADLRRAGVEDAAQLLAHGRLGPVELADLAPLGGILNTDDNAYIEYRAPVDLYRRTRGANERQIETFAAGLAPYLTGRDPESLARFLERLAAEYEARGFLGEADWTRQAAGRLAPGR